LKKVLEIFITFSAILRFEASAQQLEKPAVFFDLGNVIVNTSNWKDVHYFESALQILSELEHAGISSNLIANIPDSFGSSCEAKFERLKGFMEEVWRPGAQPFDWNQFDSVYVPPSDDLSKPHPYLFVGAASHICPRPMLFLGEDLEEVRTAEELGIGAFPVGTGPQPMFPSVAEIQNLARTMQADCDFIRIWHQIQVAIGFHGCLMKSPAAHAIERSPGILR